MIKIISITNTLIKNQDHQAESDSFHKQQPGIDQNNKSGKKDKDSKILQNTATNLYNLLLAGFIIMVAGGVIYVIQKRKHD
ncbi:LPXTG cell wall anchor domain-containing protein [Niallia sp. Krafla_26]|uniref:LPXTG cell wall anchor domain-containing protein n=1 Tax=Niallia sp. Krafla_26 TaxID=3064703 RepID=UPI003D16B2E2